MGKRKSNWKEKDYVKHYTIRKFMDYNDVFAFFLALYLYYLIYKYTHLKIGIDYYLIILQKRVVDQKLSYLKETQ